MLLPLPLVPLPCFHAQSLNLSFDERVVVWLVISTFVFLGFYLLYQLHLTDLEHVYDQIRFEGTLEMPDYLSSIDEQEIRRMPDYKSD